MYCIIPIKTYIFVLSMKQNKCSPTNKIMKKLLLLFATILISLNSMALSFPHNTYGQKRTLNQVASKSIGVSEIKTIEASLTQTLEAGVEEVTNQESFLEMFANYVISLFTEKLLHGKSIAINSFEKVKCEYLAIKQDFDCQLIG